MKTLKASSIPIIAGLFVVVLFVVLGGILILKSNKSENSYNTFTNNRSNTESKETLEFRNAHQPAYPDWNLFKTDDYVFSYPNTWIGSDIGVYTADGEQMGFCQDENTININVRVESFDELKKNAPTLLTKENFYTTSDPLWQYVKDHGGGGGISKGYINLVEVGGRQAILETVAWQSAGIKNDTCIFPLDRYYYVPPDDNFSEILTIKIRTKQDSPNRNEIDALIQQVLETFKFRN